MFFILVQLWSHNNRFISRILTILFQLLVSGNMWPVVKTWSPFYESSVCVCLYVRESECINLYIKWGCCAHFSVHIWYSTIIRRPTNSRRWWILYPLYSTSEPSKDSLATFHAKMVAPFCTSLRNQIIWPPTSRSTKSNIFQCISFRKFWLFN